MRICLKPKVYLIARSNIVNDGVNQFLEDQDLAWPTEPITDSSVNSPRPVEQLTELAGRCCYMSFGNKAGSKSNEIYLDNLIGGGPLGRNPEDIIADIDAVIAGSTDIKTEKIVELNNELKQSLLRRSSPAHGSVLEHATFSFLVTGAGRGFSHDQVRHRAGWAYSQLSTRYCDFERENSEGTWDPGFTVAPLNQLTNDTLGFVKTRLAASLTAYKDVLARVEADLSSNPTFMQKLAAYSEKEQRRILRKAARGAARDILPNGTEAIMVMSANARAIWNTISIRASEHAEAEIREVYVQIARIMEKEMPNVFKNLKYVRLWDGSEAVVLPRDKI